MATPKPIFARVCVAAWFLQTRQPTAPILVRVNQQGVLELGTTPMSLSTAVKKALDKGILEEVSGANNYKRQRQVRTDRGHATFRG